MGASFPVALTFSLNHLANKQLQSTNALYSLTNGSVTDYKQLLVDIKILTYFAVTLDFRTLTCVNKFSTILKIILAQLSQA